MVTLAPGMGGMVGVVRPKVCFALKEIARRADVGRTLFESLQLFAAFHSHIVQ